MKVGVGEGCEECRLVQILLNEVRLALAVAKRVYHSVRDHVVVVTERS